MLRFHDDHEPVNPIQGIVPPHIFAQPAHVVAHGM